MCCRARRHYSGRVNFVADLSKICENVLVCKFFKYSRQKPSTVNDDSFNAGELGDFFQFIGRASAESA